MTVRELRCFLSPFMELMYATPTSCADGMESPAISSKSLINHSTWMSPVALKVEFFSSARLSVAVSVTSYGASTHGDE